MTIVCASKVKNVGHRCETFGEHKYCRVACKHQGMRRDKTGRREKDVPIALSSPRPRAHRLAAPGRTCRPTGTTNKPVPAYQYRRLGLTATWPAAGIAGTARKRAVAARGARCEVRGARLTRRPPPAGAMHQKRSMRSSFFWSASGKPTVSWTNTGGLNKRHVGAWARGLTPNTHRGGRETNAQHEAPPPPPPPPRGAQGGKRDSIISPRRERRFELRVRCVLLCFAVVPSRGCLGGAPQREGRAGSSHPCATSFFTCGPHSTRPMATPSHVSRYAWNCVHFVSDKRRQHDKSRQQVSLASRSGDAEVCGPEVMQSKCLYPTRLCTRGCPGKRRRKSGLPDFHPKYSVVT